MKMDATEFSKAYTGGRFDHWSSGDFDKILQDEAQKRFEILHAEEIDAGVQKYTSIHQVYDRMLAEPFGVALRKASMNAACMAEYGAVIEPLQKARRPEEDDPDLVSPIADRRAAARTARGYHANRSARFRAEAIHEPEPAERGTASEPADAGWRAARRQRGASISEARELHIGSNAAS
jgi:hypothetical protein